MKRLLLLLLLLLTLPVSAQEETLEAVVADFMQEYNLNEENFSLSYYNTVTGEAYAFEDNHFMVAGSTFKVPLNMYYYEMERDGEIASDTYIPRADVPLNVAHRESLVNSDNEKSLGMLYHLGDFPTYKEKMRKYFSMTDEEIDPIYYQKNYYCTRMMMEALQYLYENQEDFTEMLDYMQQAQPDSYFRAKVQDYPVAHKYGWFEGAVNDVGIFYTDEPFLLAVYTQDVVGEQIVAEIAAVLTDYNVRHSAKPKEEENEPPAGVTLEVEMKPLHPQEEEATPPTPEPQPEPIPEEAEMVQEPTFPWWMAAGVVLIGGMVVWFRKKK